MLAGAQVGAIRIAIQVHHVDLLECVAVVSDQGCGANTCEGVRVMAGDRLRRDVVARLAPSGVGVVVLMVSVDQRKRVENLQGVIVMTGARARWVLVQAGDGIVVETVVLTRSVRVVARDGTPLVSIVSTGGAMLMARLGDLVDSVERLHGPMEMGGCTNGRHPVGNAMQGQRDSHQQRKCTHHGRARETAQGCSRLACSFHHCLCPASPGAGRSASLCTCMRLPCGRNCCEHSYNEFITLSYVAW